MEFVRSQDLFPDDFCKKVIDAHNGKIRLNADNTENEFIIELPKMDKEDLVVDFM